MITKINNSKELQNIAINHSNSTDIDYKDFLKINRECTRKLYSFLTNDTMLPANDPLRLEKIGFLLIKITVTDQIKILDRKIMQNETQFD